MPGALLLLLLAGAAPAPRVLSLNLCADQLVLGLADPGEIAGITLLARDCHISAHCAAAVRVPAVRGSAEEVMALHPTLVLGGTSGAAIPLETAKRLGIPVLELGNAAGFAAIRDQIVQVAAVLGQPERGAAMAAELDRRLADIPPPGRAAGSRPVAAILEPNGFTAGAGSLADAVLARAGLDNYATRQHLSASASIPLEYLVLHPPDLLVIEPHGGAPSMAEALLSHPALRERFVGRQVGVPVRDWICGSMATLDAVDLLTRARLALAP